MHLLSRRYFVECQLAIDTVLSRQPMAAYLCAYSSYHRLLLLGRAGSLADEVTDIAAAIRAVIRRGRCNQLRRDHPHALLLTALFVAELQRRDGSGGAGSGDLLAAVWERLSAAASNSSSRVKWIALAGRSDLLAEGGASLKQIVNTVEKLTDSMSNAERMGAAQDGALVAIARVLVARAGSGAGAGAGSGAGSSGQAAGGQAAGGQSASGQAPGGPSKALEATRLCSIFVAILLTLIEERGVPHATEQMRLVVKDGLLLPVPQSV